MTKPPVSHKEVLTACRKEQWWLCAKEGVSVQWLRKFCVRYLTLTVAPEKLAECMGPPNLVAAMMPQVVIFIVLILRFWAFGSYFEGKKADREESAFRNSLRSLRKFVLIWRSNLSSDWSRSKSRIELIYLTRSNLSGICLDFFAPSIFLRGFSQYTFVRCRHIDLPSFTNHLGKLDNLRTYYSWLVWQEFYVNFFVTKTRWTITRCQLNKT